MKKSSTWTFVVSLSSNSSMTIANLLDAEAAYSWKKSKESAYRSDEQFLLAGAAAAYERISQMILGEAMIIDPVEYQVTVTHWQDGEVDVTVKDVGDSESDRAAVAHALRLAADKVESGTPVSTKALS